MPRAPLRAICAANNHDTGKPMRRLSPTCLTLALLALLAAAQPAAAQGQDFYVQQYNSSARELSNHFSELRSLRERMSSGEARRAGK